MKVRLILTINNILKNLRSNQKAEEVITEFIKKQAVFLLEETIIKIYLNKITLFL